MKTVDVDDHELAGNLRVITTKVRIEKESATSIITILISLKSEPNCIVLFLYMVDKFSLSYKLDVLLLMWLLSPTHHRMITSTSQKNVNNKGCTTGRYKYK